MNDILSNKVKELALDIGADLVGITSNEAFTEAPEGHRPEDILENAKSVIVIAIGLPEACFDSAPSREYSIAYVAANNELNRMAFRIAKFLQNEGHRAVQIPATMPYDYKTNMGDLSHRHAGYLSGIGDFGKNSLLLSEKYGPRMRLVTIVTNAELSSDRLANRNFCESCEKCIESCPSGALKGALEVDKRKCDAQHLKVGKSLDLEDWEQICGVCIKVCPIGKSSIDDSD